MNVKEKLKRFWEEHGETIKVTGALIGLMTGGVLLGISAKGTYDAYRMNKALKSGDPAIGVLDHAKRHYANGCCDILSGFEDDPVKVSDMGELGNRIISLKPEAANFKGTHFIMIGPNNT